ncbi:MAG: rhodanese-related sulfurtransferase [Flavobacteriaceae bacterium]|nr:rhodanese-related sulfurtransferase [Bacteroidia bacterium]MBT8288348.1 rhodanese-related sulfurtransferase [Bacteroidia bacterium]NNF75228.1 rhodanese-related sulfurtransferase [Flavobacteriaceae bacterium]NNK73844.1 rhodanese-related sulfurtransferase [Flavobacteriaceae bacterium]
MQLYNKLSAKEREELIKKAGKDRLTLSFYKYAHIQDTKSFRDQLFMAWDNMQVLGRIYVANEGINAQLSLPADRFNDFKSHLDSIPFLKNVRLNIAIEQDNFSFLKLKIKVRHKIVADGLKDSSFDVTDKGIHVNAAEFNTLLENENTICVDMRNHYESEIGHFENAITPDVDTFRDSLPIIEEDLSEFKEYKNLLMYCTGGIRCEKASAYFKHKGFKNVYQLEGGIIEYTRQVESKNLENKFIGKNFVFDDRRAERISDDIIAQCHQCGNSCDTHTNCANDACHLLFIQCDACKAEMDNCCSTNCKEIHNLPYEEQKALRKGQGNSNDIFKKGRADYLPYKQDLRNIFEVFQKNK